MTEWSVASDEAVGSVKDVTVTWSVDLSTESAYPWDLPTLRDEKKVIIINHKLAKNCIFYYGITSPNP